MSKFLGWFFDKIMANSVADFEEGVGRPYPTQEKSLGRILRRNAKTEFGKRHGFAKIASLKPTELWRRYRHAVPIRSYEDFLPDIERMKNGEQGVLVPGMPQMFSLTSGTTSVPKFCPVTRAFIKEHHRQHLLWMYNVYRDHPEVNEGKYLVVSSPAVMGRTPGGIPYGAMSGKQLEVQSIPVRRRQAAPALIGRLAEAEDRWFNLLLFAVAQENLRVVTAVNPSSLVAIADRLARDSEALIECLEKGHPGTKKTDETAATLASAFKPDRERARRLREILRVDGTLRPSSVWPNLKLLLTWQGGASSFYLPHVSVLWGNVPMRCLGLRASEGTFSIPLKDNTPSGVLALGGHAMEFVHATEDPIRSDAPTLLAGQLEEGGLYRIIITTSGGFYRYDLGDLVRVTGFRKKTPEIAFERRAGSVLSATGEKVTEDQVVAAMEAAAANGPLLNGFSVTWEMHNDVVRYVAALECSGGNEMLRQRRMLRDLVKQLLAVFDHELMHRNVEYQGKREDGRIAPPRAIILADRSYEYYKARLAASGKPEGQIKQPILIRPPGPGKAPVKGCAFFDEMEIAAEF